MKNEEEMWLGGFESPQYIPSIREEVESPSYKVNESELKIVNICLSLCSLKVENYKKKNSRATIGEVNFKEEEAEFNKLTGWSLNEPSQITPYAIISRKSR